MTNLRQLAETATELDAIRERDATARRVCVCTWPADASRHTDPYWLEFHPYEEGDFDSSRIAVHDRRFLLARLEAAERKLEELRVAAEELLDPLDAYANPDNQYTHSFALAPRRDLRNALSKEADRGFQIVCSMPEHQTLRAELEELRAAAKAVCDADVRAHKDRMGLAGHIGYLIRPITALHAALSKEAGR